MRLIRPSSWLWRVLAVLVIAVPVGLFAPSAAQAAFCGISWGSLPKTHAASAADPLTNVRAGRHACYDRLVLDTVAKADGYSVRYVANVYEDASGRLVPLRGGAKLQIVVQAPAYDPQTGAPTYTPANGRELVDVTGWRTLRQVAFAGSFEGTTTIGVGVRARLPFRVFVLAGPGTHSRIVIDVAHRW